LPAHLQVLTQNKPIWFALFSIRRDFLADSFAAIFTNTPNHQLSQTVYRFLRNRFHASRQETTPLLSVNKKLIIQPDEFDSNRQIRIAR